MAIAALLLAAAVGLRTGNMPDFGVLEDYAQYLLFAFWIGGCAFALGSFFHLAQDIVWSGYIGATPGSLGISAFPSMHVAMAVLFALYATRRSRLAGLLMWAFAAIIMVGSVVLGWHYAVGWLCERSDFDRHLEGVRVLPGQVCTRGRRRLT